MRRLDRLDHTIKALRVMTGHIDPTKETFAAFRANDRAGPIHMLNLVRLRERAAYPDGRAGRCFRASAARSSGADNSSSC
jgi:hypothetical protein